MTDLVITGGTVLTVDGSVRSDVLVRDGIIAAIGAGDGADEVLDASGAWVGPGFVDLHTHLREPGEEWKEDIASGSAAAADGGYTAVVAMPNTSPPTDAGHLARYVADRGREVGIVDVHAAGCVSMGRAGERLAHLDELLDAGVRLFTDDGDAVVEAGLMRRAMEYLESRGACIAQHAVDPSLAAAGHMHEGSVSSRLGMNAIPAAAEEVMIARDLRLVELTGASYHVQHVASSRGVELVAEARRRGLPVTAEVTPHHLMFDHTAVATTDSTYKMMPPLREGADREALVAALRDGTIDAVATDHAPHASHEKDVPFEEAPNGVTGLEWAAAVVNTVAGLDIAAFFERMSVAPARIAAIDGHGRLLAPGVPANLVVFDPGREWTPQATRSRSSNAPYLGRTLHGRVLATFLRGRRTAWTAAGAVT